MSGKVRVGIIGTGFMGTTHMKCWSMIPEAKITGIVGYVNYERASNFAKEYDAKPYKTMEKALEEGEIDVVDICTPTFTHKDLALKALTAERHLLLEKPIALNLKDADTIIEASKTSKKKFMVAHCIRFFSEYIKVKELVDNSILGDLCIARAYRAGPLPGWGVESWFKDQEKSGGVAVDLIIHDIDFLRWCFNDEVERVYSKIGRFVLTDATMDDHALLILKFKDGGIAHIEGSWAVPQEYPFTYTLEIAGTKGFLAFDNHSPNPITIFSKEKVEKFNVDSQPWIEGMPFPIDPYYREIRHFTDCILNDRDPMTGGLESRKALEISMAAKASSQTGLPVTLPLEV